jgi:predicted transcriptional regulator
MLEMTTDVVASYLQHNRLSTSDLPGLIGAVHSALAGIDAPAAVVVDAVTKRTSAQIRKSIADTHLICFEDGKPYKMLKRTLTKRGMTMADYREKWGLPKDYPATAPAYSASRSALAKAIGLGSKGQAAKAAVSAEKPPGRVVMPAKRTMKPAVTPAV